MPRKGLSWLILRPCPNRPITQPVKITTPFPGDKSILKIERVLK